MSDEDESKPSSSTSTVPLKKETVRISLKAPKEDSGPVAPKGSTTPIPSDQQAGESGEAPAASDATTPVSSGGAAPPPPPPSAPASPSGGAPTPPAPPSAPPPPPGTPDPNDPTQRVETSGPDPLGPTQPVQTKGAGSAQSAAPAGGDTAPVGAKTIPLAKAPGGPGAPGKATVPLQEGGAQPLPPATQPMGHQGTITQQPNIQSTADTADEDWDEEYEEAGLMPFAIIVLLLAIAVLAIELVTKLGAGG